MRKGGGGVSVSGIGNLPDPVAGLIAESHLSEMPATLPALGTLPRGISDQG